jgi:glycosyltransferase involved in cell wall biosynthesis
MLQRLREKGFDFYQAHLGFISASMRYPEIRWTLVQLLKWPALVYEYSNLVTKIKPCAVVHTNWHHALLLLPYLDKRRDIYWSHEIVAPSAQYRWIFGAISRRVAAFVCVSKAAAESFRRIGVPAERLVVVHNGVPIPDTIEPPQMAASVRIGIVGQVAAWKGHDDAIEALALLPQGRVVLEIFGSGEARYVESLKQKAARLGVGGSINWRGFVRETNRIFSAIDICIVPSRFEEPFGASAAEASCAGRPVIGTRVGGLPEIIVDGSTGILIAPRRPDLLASAIMDLIDDPDRAVAMGRSGAVHGKSELGVARFVQKFLDQIDRIQASGPR